MYTSSGPASDEEPQSRFPPHAESRGHGTRLLRAHVFTLYVCVAAAPRSVLWLQGSISAVNGLGWYHGTVLKEHAKALEYYQRAAFNGSSADAAFNLGVYRLNGKHPWRPERNEVRHGGKLILMEALARKHKAEMASCFHLQVIEPTELVQWCHFTVVPLWSTRI